MKDTTSIVKKIDKVTKEFNVVITASKQMKLDQQKDLLNIQGLQRAYKEFETLMINDEVSKVNEVVTVIEGKMKEMKDEFDVTKNRISEYGTKDQEFGAEIKSLQRSYKDLNELKTEMEAAEEVVETEETEVTEEAPSEEKGSEDESKE